MYEDEKGECPPPAEMVGPCAHRQECPTCKHHVEMNCTCDGAGAVNYVTAVLSAHYEKRG